MQKIDYIRLDIVKFIMPVKSMKIYLSVFCLCFPPLFLSAAEPDSRNYFHDAETEYAKKNYQAAYQLYSETRDKLRGQNLPKEQFRSLWLAAGEQIVRCLIAMNDNAQASEEYFLLCRVEPLMSPDVIPLPWFVSPAPQNSGQNSDTKPREATAENILDPLQKTKNEHSKTESPAAILLAAGILSVSNNPVKQQTGRQQLRQLAATLENEVDSKEKNNLLFRRQYEAALLAKVLLWKEQIPLVKTADDLLPMKRLLKKISEPQRAGAYFLLGNAARQAGQPEQAILFWMRVPVLYEYNRPLAAKALKEAADELKKLGRREQAENLIKTLSY
jgi:hypothetical protein